MNKSDRHPKDECHELAPLDSARLTAASVPARVRIAPWGEVDSTRGRFVVDDEAAAMVVAAFEEHGTDLPVDYEHQTLGGPYASPTGQAPAAGWIKRLESVPGVGIFAHVEWTDNARAQLAAKEYRYLSPVALVRKSDRKIVGLHSVALTNKPAIVGMEPIVNRVDGDTLETLREQLKLEPDADVHTVLLAASRRMDTFERDNIRRNAQDKVDAAVRCGKVTEAQREFAMRLVLRDAGLFEEWLAASSVQVPLGRTVPPSGSTTKRRVAVRAAAEFRSNPLLSALTSEEAFIADAHRRNGHGQLMES